MKAIDYLGMMETRMLKIISAGIILLLLALIFSSVMMPKIKEYKAVEKSRAVLEDISTNQVNLNDEISLQKQSVEQLVKSIHGEMMSIPDQYIESFVISMLQKISLANHVNIGSIQPVPWRTLKSYRELLFNVEFTGDYIDLYHLINDMSEEMGFIVVNKMEMHSQQTGSKVLVMKMTIASYRIQE